MSTRDLGPNSKTTEILIREFCDADAPIVARFWDESAETWPAGFSNGVPNSAERILAGRRISASVNLYLAFARQGEEERLLGYCNLTDDREGDPDVAYVALLNVHPAALGKGIGKLLLRRAIDRTIELGRNRLDLHTWPGNVRAVPLYKKVGFYWVPDTSVLMENYLPGILRQPITRRFLGSADWYDCYRRALDQSPDEQKHLDRPAYVYDFEREGRRLRWAIDPASHSPFAVESDDLRASLRAPGRSAVGSSATATLEFTVPADSTPVAASLRAEGGVASSPAVVGGPGAAGVVAIDITAREIDARSRVVADLSIGGERLELRAGIAVVPRLSLSIEPGVPLRPDRPGSLAITASNDSGDSLDCTLILAADPGFAVEPSAIPIQLAPGERLTLGLRATAGPGAHTLAHRVLSRPDGRPLQPAGRLTVAAVALGEVIAAPDEPATIETSRLRCVADASGTVRVFDRATGEQVAAPNVRFGPPFVPGDPGLHCWAARAEASDGRGQLTLRATITERPVEVVETFAVSADDLLRVAITVRNLGVEPIELNARLGASPATPPAVLERTTVPLRVGLVSTTWPDFPDLHGLVLPMADYAEGWVALGAGDRTIGLAWERAAGITWDWGGPQVELPIPEVPSGECRSAPAALVALGASRWREVRDRWRDAFAPGAPAEAPRPSDVVAIQCRPDLVAPRASTTLELHSFLGRPQSGSVYIEPAPAWRLARTERAVSGLALGAPANFVFEADPPTPGPAATVARGWFRSDLGAWPVEVPFIHLGDADGDVSITSTEDSSETIDVANGFWSFRVAPGFAGSVTSLVLRGAELLSSAYPNPRARAWSYPWYGGVVPSLHPSDPGRSHGPSSHDEVFRAEPRRQTVRNEFRLGLPWSGVRLVGEAKRWPGLAVEVGYLTAPNSNTLLVTMRLRNESRGRISCAADVTAFLSAGDSGRPAEIHTVDDEGKVSVVRQAVYRTVAIPSCGWAAVRDDSGRATALARITGDGKVFGLEWGRSGVHLGFWTDAAIDPGESSESVAALVLAPDVASAWAYRWLAEANSRTEGRKGGSAP